MNTILVIARLTFREAVRRKIVLAVMLLGGVFLLLYGVGFFMIQQSYQGEVMGVTAMRAQYRQQANYFLLLAGMYVINFLAIASGALISADSLAGEIQSGIIQATVTKPIRRSGVVLGKWLGQAFLLFLYLLLMGGGVVIIVRVFGNVIAPNWLGGIALIYLNSLIVMTLTLALSSSFSTLATGGAVFGAYGVAFLGGWVERIGTLVQDTTATNLGIFSSLLLPTEAVWSKASTMMSSPLLNLLGVNPFSAASEPSILMMVYAVLYLLLLLGIAVRRFGQRDL